MHVNINVYIALVYFGFSVLMIYLYHDDPIKHF